MNDLVSTLVQQHFAVSGGELLVGHIAVKELARQYGTPLFVYDGAVMQRSLAALRAALPRRFAVCFSVKANPNVSVLRHFLALGCRLEIASAGEFQSAVKAGCPPERVLFAGPGKTETELEFVVSQGIGEIHLESRTEAKRLGEICRRLGTRAKVAIRVNPLGEAEGGAMRMGGRPAPFGVDEEELDAVLDEVLADSALEFRGIHLFAGTQILDHAILLAQYSHGLEIARRVSQRAQRPLKTLDFGGGLGIPYFAHEHALDLERLREGLLALFSAVETDPWLRETQFLVEPGRFLVGEAGLYVARVNDIKVSRGKKFLILDGGMNHHLAASGNLGQTIKRNYPVALANRMEVAAEEAVDVVGPLCTPLDTLARNVNLPHAEIGDLLVIFQSGAYGRSASPVDFLSHPAPAEVFVQAGRHELIRERGRGSEAAVIVGAPALAHGRPGR
jgi:diaminopimelate decarboxylase